jgi:hypothetical protein
LIGRVWPVSSSISSARLSPYTFHGFQPDSAAPAETVEKGQKTRQTRNKGLTDTREFAVIGSVNLNSNNYDIGVEGNGMAAMGRENDAKTERQTRRNLFYSVNIDELAQAANMSLSSVYGLFHCSRSELSVSDDREIPSVIRQKPIRMVSLFSGCGSFDLGFAMRVMTLSSRTIGMTHVR